MSLMSTGKPRFNPSRKAASFFIESAANAASVDDIVRFGDGLPPEEPKSREKKPIDRIIERPAESMQLNGPNRWTRVPVRHRWQAPMQLPSVKMRIEHADVDHRPTIIGMESTVDRRLRARIPRLPLQPLGHRGWAVSEIGGQVHVATAGATRRARGHWQPSTPTAVVLQSHAALRPPSDCITHGLT